MAEKLICIRASYALQSVIYIIYRLKFNVTCSLSFKLIYILSVLLYSVSIVIGCNIEHDTLIFVVVSLNFYLFSSLQRNLTF